LVSRKKTGQFHPGGRRRAHRCLGWFPQPFWGTSPAKNGGG
jgi:hypothetical protein